MKEAVANANAGLSLQEQATVSKKVIVLIDTGTNDGLADVNVNLTNGSDEDVNGHGTKMTKAIRKYAGNNAMIISVKAFYDNGAGSLANLVAAVQYAIDANADIINISLADYLSFFKEENMIQDRFNIADKMC